jgi:hypothetical protein
MKIDTSTLNEGANYSPANAGQSRSNSVNQNPENTETLDSQRLHTVLENPEAGLQRYPSMKMALRNLTSSRIFRDASAHIQFASSINHQRVMAERVQHLTTI